MSETTKSLNESLGRMHGLSFDREALAECIEEMGMWKARTKKLEAALRDLLLAGSSASLGDNREYRMAEELGRDALASVPE